MNSGVPFFERKASYQNKKLAVAVWFRCGQQEVFSPLIIYLISDFCNSGFLIPKPLNFGRGLKIKYGIF